MTGTPTRADAERPGAPALQLNVNADGRPEIVNVPPQPPRAPPGAADDSPPA